MRERREADDYNENRIAGWAGSQIITVPAGLGAVPVESNLIVQAQLKTETYLTAQFSIATPAVIPSAILPRARAEVIWTVQGNSCRRLIDIVSGAVISGPARNFNIKVSDNTAFSGALHPADFQYVVSCQVAPGTRPGGSQFPILMPPPSEDGFQTVADGSNFTYNVPRDAGVIAAFISCGNNLGGPIDPIGAEVNVVISAGFLINQFLNYDALNQWIPLQPGTDRIRIFNQGFAPSLNFSVMYGVEG